MLDRICISCSKNLELEQDSLDYIRFSRFIKSQGKGPSTVGRVIICWECFQKNAPKTFVAHLEYNPNKSGREPMSYEGLPDIA